MLKRTIDQKLRMRNFDARHGRLESGAVFKSRKGLIGVEGGKRFLITLNVQEFVTTWDEILLSKSKIPADDLLESLYKLRICESDHFKTVLKLYDLEIHQKISKPVYQRWETMVDRNIDQKLRSRNFEASDRERGLKHVQWLRIAGVNVVLRECQENAGSGKQKDSVRKEVVVVPETMKINVQNRHQCPLLPLNHRQEKMVETNRSNVSARGHLVILGI